MTVPSLTPQRIPPRRLLLVALAPIAALAAQHFGGAAALGGASLAGAALLARPRRPHVPPLEGRALIEVRLEEALRAGGEGRTACFVVVVDDLPRASHRVGRRDAGEIAPMVGERLRATCRSDDVVARLEDGSHAVALASARHTDTEALLRLAGRMQSAVARGLPIGGRTLQLSASVGLCGEDAGARTGAAMIEAAEIAADEAVLAGPGATRSFTPRMGCERRGRDARAGAAARALERGEIVPWFQPQIDTGTGMPSGFETLARWRHPVRGPLPPSEFLPELERAGLLPRLGDKMLDQALEALAGWDRAGVRVPQVGINVSGPELADPTLPARIAHALDGWGLTPGRLAVEVLETVVAGTEDDVICRNLAEIAAMGCGVDLDDFGTGQASIGVIRRFSIRRLKIDRSFVARLDSDDGQRRMVAAIVEMAARLDLATVAEGAETPEELAVLSQLGCDAVQGFGVARPMPADAVPGWIAARAAALANLPRVGHAT
ncbi:diguanylate cyclase/phosphodiesterase [Hasllibacter halocynthiae]|uniref:Diguanylate cyclase/phosphodiesterase n=1 Tax=Hasllibacter halocynthiae TaxID=595589 RepID=A0A2T0X3P8_9RHOB|nr:GGDEF domain-containing phosphodiesterase [Hasllibacter halocynthiae]PRY93525.1 diguanylate cyclase/phosphodiesterase [Hasllibacter halocynthiae]